MFINMDTGPPVWTEVRYGTLRGLKALLQTLTREEALAPGGKHLTSPLHEAISRQDIDMVNALRKAGVDIAYKPHSGEAAGLTAYRYAVQVRHNSPFGSDITRNLLQEQTHGLEYAQQHAIMAKMKAKIVETRALRDKHMAFAMGHHHRTGQDSWVSNLERGVVDMILKEVQNTHV